MKIILVKQVTTLGNAGDIIEVAPGYGRNYLIAKGLANEATQAALEQARADQQKKVRKQNHKEKSKNKLKSILQGQTILIRGKANEEGHLFGGIGPKEIVENIKKRKKLDIDPKSIKLTHHLKALGNHEAVIDLGQGDSITINIEVVRNE